MLTYSDVSLYADDALIYAPSQQLALAELGPHLWPLHTRRTGRESCSRHFPCKDCDQFKKMNKLKKNLDERMYTPVHKI